MLEYMFIDRYCLHSSVFLSFEEKVLQGSFNCRMLQQLFLCTAYCERRKKSKDQLAITSNKQLTFMQ